MKASLFKSPGDFSVFWSIIIMPFPLVVIIIIIIIILKEGPKAKIYLDSLRATLKNTKLENASP